MTNWNFEIDCKKIFALSPTKVQIQGGFRLHSIAVGIWTGSESFIIESNLDYDRNDDVYFRFNISKSTAELEVALNFIENRMIDDGVMLSEWFWDDLEVRPGAKCLVDPFCSFSNLPEVAHVIQVGFWRDSLFAVLPIS